MSFESNTTVWLTDPSPTSNLAYIACTITSASPTSLTLAPVAASNDTGWLDDIYDDNLITLPSNPHPTVFPQNPPLPPNAPAITDLTNLPFLNPATLLHALSERYEKNDIYTATGPILIAINPFEKLPLYGKEIVDTYRTIGISSQFLTTSPSVETPPHIFKTTDAAFRAMTTSRQDQSLLISGESGAGKTETTKHALRYLTGISKDGEGDVITTLLSSTPLLECIGNAMTNRNSNSSRFGLLRSLSFERSSLVGASIETYLLESIRVSHHVPGERTFHVLYLVAGLKEEKTLLQRYTRDGMTLEKSLRYLSLGGAPVCDFEMSFSTFKTALTKIGVDVDGVVSFLSVILHLGEITFSLSAAAGSGDDEFVCDDATVLQCISKLSGADPAHVEKALTERCMTTRNETFFIKNKLEQCITIRDAIARHMYKMLFDYLVVQINRGVATVPTEGRSRTTINVLDIFGFESFVTNTFEQLCINYTNECLQEQFNKHVFQQQQLEYIREGIAYEEVKFKSNQYIIDVIQSSTGILGQLDDECKLPKGDDGRWARKMYQHFLKDGTPATATAVFRATPKQQRDGTFVVSHFAGLVEYTSRGFVEKNKDSVLPETSALFTDKECLPFFRTTLASDSDDSSGASKSTISGKFKKSLTSLLKKIESTAPHYVRCLKPNDEAKPQLLVRSRLTEQLRYGGVLEAVRVCREGYAVKFAHDEFVTRYSALFTASTSPEALLKALIDGTEGGEGSFGPSSAKIALRLGTRPPPLKFDKLEIQLGKTKVFMKTHVHSALEAQVTFKNTLATILIQACTRRFTCKRLFSVYRYRVGVVQRWWRGQRGRWHAQGLRREKAGGVLGRALRMLLARKRFKRVCRGVLAAQLQWRRRRVMLHARATRIQTAYRRWQAEGVYWGLIKCMTTLQNRFRCYLAVNARKKLKTEGRDIGKLSEEKERLKQEMVALKSMLKVQQKEREKTQLLKNEEEETKMWKLKCEKLQRDLEAASVAASPKPPPLSRSNSASSPPPPSPTKNAPPYLAAIERLQSDLHNEQTRRIAAEREVIVLRAKMNGVDLSPEDIDNLVTDLTMTVTSPKPQPRSAARIELRRSSSSSLVVDKKEIILNSQKLVEDEARKIGNVWKDNWDDDDAESDEEDGEEVSRMQKTLKLRDEVRRFEQKMDRFSQDFQEGLDLTLWQVNKNSLADSDDEDAFCVESQPVTAKLDLKGDKGESGLLTASVLFNGRVGYLRSSSVFGVLAGKIGGGDEVVNPLPLHEILDVRAGVVGGKNKKEGVGGYVKGKVFQNTGLFITVIAVATPATPQRAFLMKFGSRQERNDCLGGMRKLLADVQIVDAQTQAGGKEVGSASPFRNHGEGGGSIFKKKEKGAGGLKVYGSGGEKGAKTMVLLSDVHRQLSKERSSYERLMVQMLQSTFDLQEKEDEFLGLVECIEKEKKGKTRERRKSGARSWWGGGGKGGEDATEMNSVVMQLSRKLEELLIDNEDLREQVKRAGGGGRSPAK